MSWRDNLRPASYKGVTFEVLGDEATFGRRSIVHEYPDRDEADSDDLGKKARLFKVDAVISPGDDFMARRDRLIKVLEDEASPGILIHPYYGQHFVKPSPFTVTHSSTEGGWCRLALEFTVVSAKGRQPAQSIDTGYAVAAAAAELSDQASADLAAGLSIDGEPNHVAAAAQSVIGKAQESISAAAAKLTGAGQPLNDFVRQAQSIKANLIGLAAEPTALAANLSSLLAGLSDVADTPEALAGVLQPLLDFGGGLLNVPRSTPARAREADNQDAVVQFVQRAAAAELVLAIANSSFSSYEDAVAVRDTVNDKLDDLAVAAADAGQGDAYAALSAARLAMVRDVTARGGSLQHLYAFTPAGTTPALVLAHRLFASVDDIEDNYTDLVGRNGVVHPGFVPGGRSLEVLTDG